MRKSLLDIKHMVKDIAIYPKMIPEELIAYHYYILDCGHSIMCVLNMHLEKAKKTNFDDYEIPVPVKYVLETGYKIVDGYVFVDAEYDITFGLMVDEKYTEF